MPDNIFSDRRRLRFVWEYEGADRWLTSICMLPEVSRSLDRSICDTVNERVVTAVAIFIEREIKKLYKVVTKNAG